MFTITEELKILLNHILENNSYELFPMLADKLEDCGYSNIYWLAHLREYKLKCGQYINYSAEYNYKKKWFNVSNCSIIEELVKIIWLKENNITQNNMN